MLAEFSAELGKCAFQERNGVCMVSTVTGGEISEVGSDYWAAHLPSAVRFLDGMKALETIGVQTFVEIGSDAVLTKMGKRCVSGDTSQWAASLVKGEEARLSVQAVEKLFKEE